MRVQVAKRALEVPQTVAVRGLARASGPEGAQLPGKAWVTAEVQSRIHWRLQRGRWLLALHGSAIVDLPHGDSRLLHPGDALELPTGLELHLQPVADAVTLLWHDD